MRAARLALFAVALLGTLARHLRGGGASRRAQGSARVRAPARTRRRRTRSRALPRSPGARFAARPATSSSSRRAGRSTGAPSSGRTSRPARAPASSAGRDHQRSCSRRRERLGDATESARRGQDAHRADPDPGDLGQPRAPVVHGQAVRPLRPRARGRRRGAPPRGAGRSASTCAGSRRRFRSREARSRALDARRGRDRVRRLVPGHPQGHSGRTRTSPTSASSTRSTSRTAGGNSFAGASARCGRSSEPSPTACPQSPTGRGARRTRPTNPAWAAGKLQLRAAVSDAVSTDSKAAAHQLMPAMTFGGDHGSTAASIGSSAPTPSPIATA